jgi:quinol monooxygenase YgiN
MYAQATAIKAPADTMRRLRELIQSDYLPEISRREGFVLAQFLEQTDDPDSALLITFWRDQQSIEAFQNTGSLRASLNSLPTLFPGLKLEREGYVVSLSAEPEAAAHL